MDNNRLFEIFINKVYLRLRNKTQMFSSHSGDHYHTRMVHSLEVEAIAKQVGERLNRLKYSQNNTGRIYPFKSVNITKVSEIALLHDIGHTPFGHVGEKTLNDILCGNDNLGGRLPDVKALGLAIGFKHNINSGTLFVENFKLNNKDDMTPSEYLRCLEVLDGIMKHSKVYYSWEVDGRDFKTKRECEEYKAKTGFDYVNPTGLLDNGYGEICHTFFKDYDDYYYDRMPMTIEGKIVNMCDEIAQVSSDISDFFENASHVKYMKDIEKSYPFNTIPFDENTDVREYVNKVKNALVKELVQAFANDETGHSFFTDTPFGRHISEFDKVTRRNHIHKMDTIKRYDAGKRKIVSELFYYYYKNPIKLPPKVTAKIFRAFWSLDLSSQTLDEMHSFGYHKGYLAPAILQAASEIDETDKNNPKYPPLLIQLSSYLTDRVIPVATKTCDTSNISKSTIKVYQRMYKTFMRRIAMNISTMTDDYADHQYRTKVLPELRKANKNS